MHVLAHTVKENPQRCTLFPATFRVFASFYQIPEKTQFFANGFLNSEIKLFFCVW